MLHLSLHSICPLAHSLFSSPHRFLSHTTRPPPNPTSYLLLSPALSSDEPGERKKRQDGKKESEAEQSVEIQTGGGGKGCKDVRPCENPWVNEFIFRKGFPAIRVTSQVADLQHGSKPVTGSRNETPLALAVLISRRNRSVCVGRFNLLETLRQTGRGSRRWRTASRRRGMV